MMKPCYRRLHIALDDVSHANLLPHLPKAVHFIARALEGGGRVMVHCAAGISRSATVGCWAACHGWLPQSAAISGCYARALLAGELHHSSCPSHDSLGASGLQALLQWLPADFPS